MKNKVVFILVFFIILLALSMNAEAAIDNKDIFDNVLNNFKTSAATWSKVITQAATWLYWLLVTISLVITFGFMILRKADIGELFAEFIRFTLFVGFFWWLLINGPNFSYDIILSLSKLAGNASGFGYTLSPSNIVDIGFEIVFRTIDWMSLSSPLESLVGITLASFIFVFITLIGFNILLLLVTAWILIYAGIFFLGFGGSRWTSDIAINYYKTVLGLAIQILAVILIVGIGKTFIDSYFLNMSKAIELKEYFIMFVTTFIIYLLIDKVPGYLSGVITGASIGQNAGSVSGGAALAAAGAALGASAMALKESAAQLGGATSAGYNAVKEASQLVNSGEDIVTSMMNSSSYSSEETKAKTPGDTPLGKAMGFSSDTAKMVAQTTANLTSGAWGATKESMNDAVSNTVGGKIAEQIKNSGSEQTSEEGTETRGSKDNSSGIDSGNFSGDYFAATQNNDTALDEEAEIAAFRDKNT